MRVFFVLLVGVKKKLDGLFSGILKSAMCFFLCVCSLAFLDWLPTVIGPRVPSLSWLHVGLYSVWIRLFYCGLVQGLSICNPPLHCGLVSRLNICFKKKNRNAQKKTLKTGLFFFCFLRKHARVSCVFLPIRSGPNSSSACVHTWWTVKRPRKKKKMTGKRRKEDTVKNNQFQIVIRWNPTLWAVSMRSLFGAKL